MKHKIDLRGGPFCRILSGIMEKYIIVKSLMKHAFLDEVGLKAQKISMAM
jgi:hypothetical protein